MGLFMEAYSLEFFASKYLQLGILQQIYLLALIWACYMTLDPASKETAWV